MLARPDAICTLAPRRESLLFSFRPAILLSLNAFSQESSVNGDGHARYEVRGFRSQKDRGADQFLQLPETAHRCPPEDTLQPFWNIQHLRVQRRPKHAGRDRIDTDAVRRPLHRQRSDSALSIWSLMCPTKNPVAAAVMTRNRTPMVPGTLGDRG